MALINIILSNQVTPDFKELETTYYMYVFLIKCCLSPTFWQDLEEFVNGSGGDGFVVFTLGSMVANMPEDKAKLFFDDICQIPQRVFE